jgi:hypothetical protein
MYQQKLIKVIIYHGEIRTQKNKDDPTSYQEKLI